VAADDFDLDEWSNLGNILVRQGTLTDDQLKRLLREQAKRQKTLLGELAVELRMADAEDIERALETQRINRVPAPTDTLQRAQETFSRAFAKLDHQAERLTQKRKTVTGVLKIPFSPSDA